MGLVALVTESILSVCWGINVASLARKCKMKKFACAYANLKVAELDRNNICMFNVVYTYHNHAVEPSNTVAIAISPFNGASAW